MITVDNSMDIVVGDTVYISEPIHLKWWVKLWNFITFKKSDKLIKRKYIVASAHSDTCVTLAGAGIYAADISSTCRIITKKIETESESNKPKQPNFVKFQNNGFKRRGRK